MLDYLVFSPKGVKRWSYSYLVLGKQGNRGMNVGKQSTPFNRAICLNAPAVRRGQLWRLVSYLSLHFGLFHLAVNCAALWAMGGLLERQLGPWRYLLVLLASGLFVGLLTVIHFPASEFGQGASPAIYGALAVLAIMLLREPQLLEAISWPGRIYLLLYALSNVVDPGNLFPHGFGFLAGVGLAFILLSANG
ncbi:MAG: rhomboid family intramembrane serine protease [Oscillospiraceae bacterium]|nr:rhomboid family intramembrane serine protease [Oscillospiraceae bacterium]